MREDPVAKIVQPNSVSSVNMLPTGGVSAISKHPIKITSVVLDGKLVKGPTKVMFQPTSTFLQVWK
jgi:hypothetical protein